MFIPRDVVFHEDTFPFHSITTLEELVDPFPDLVLPSPTLADPIPTHQIQLLLPLSLIPALHSAPSSAIIPQRRSSSTIKPPSYLREYHCNILSHIDILDTTFLCPLSNVL